MNRASSASPASPESVLLRAGSRGLAVFLDYDGTLTPIVERPELAVLSEPAREAVRELARRCTVAVVSGRDLADVRKRVGVTGIFYAGSHGFDIAGPKGKHAHPGAAAAAPELSAAGEELARETAGIPGVQLERKRFSLAIHYRRARDADVPTVEAAVDRARLRHPALRKTLGKKVFELQPDVEWDKGRAVLWLLERLELADDQVLPVYIGDDETDEDAFRALAKRGMGIAVQEAPRETAAAFTLRDPDEVREFLAELARRLT